MIVTNHPPSLALARVRAYRALHRLHRAARRGERHRLLLCDRIFWLRLACFEREIDAYLARQGIG